MRIFGKNVEDQCGITSHWKGISWFLIWQQTYCHVFSLRMSIEKNLDRGCDLFLAYLNLGQHVIRSLEIWDVLQAKQVLN